MLTLKKNYEFQSVLKKGKWYSGDLLNMYILKNNNVINNLGVAVGKKVSKSSVKRNRIRRLIKEAFRLEENNIIKGNNIVIVWKTSCSFELANFQDIKKDIRICLNKANLINENKGESANV